MGAGAMLACQATLSAEYSPDKYRAASVAVVTSGYPMGAMMTSVVAGYIMPEYGWRGMFWFGGVFTLTMGLVAWMLIPESLKYLFERRPENALARVNGILKKLKKPTLSELPAVDAGKKDKDSNLFRVMLKLLAPEHRLKTITLWTAFFLCFSTLYFLMSWIPKLMEDSGLMAWMSTRWKLSNLIFVLSFASAVGMVIFAFAPNQLSLLMALILIIGILQQGGFTGLYGAASKVYPTEIRSTGIGWAIGLGRSGAVAGIAGYLIVAGFDMSANFIFFAIPMAIGGFIAYLLHIR
jgi:MFS family permease